MLSLLIPVLVDDAFAAEGDITAVKTQSEGNNLEHDTDRGKWNSLVQVDSDTYALAYKGKDKDGFISTFTISSDGTTITKVDTLEHDTVLGEHNSLVQVDSDTYALAYRGAGEDGFISTFTIDSDGNITAVKTQSEGNNLEHDTSRGKWNSLVQVDSDTYALAYEGQDRDGFISTFTISSDGTSIVRENTLEHDTNAASFNSLVQVDSDTYALAYTSWGEDGFISTFTIDSDGVITAVKTQSENNNLEYDEERGIYNSLVHVDSDTYALAYTRNDADGYITTFTISSDGSSITKVPGAILEHDTVLGNYNSLVQVDCDTYALAYAGDGADGFISTFTISSCEIIEEEKKRSGACGFDRDCTAPRITNHGTSETPDGFSINDNIFEENQERYNKNPTIQGTVGEPVTIKVRTWENMGTDKITLAIAYLAMHEDKPDWRDSTAFIEYHIAKNQVIHQDDDGIFLLTGASAEKVEDPYGDNPALELLDITFTMIFAKPMESSHIGIQTIDHITNYDLVYFENALEILPREIVQVEEMPEEVPEKVPESLPEVVPEEIPEPEPEVKEPEPEVMLTTIDEKTVLEFVDENMPAKHYVKRYITETEYKEWFDVNYSEYKFWEGIGITQERFDQIVLEIESEPEPKMIQTGFVFVPEDEKSLPLVEETYEPEPAEIEPVKEEKRGFFDWLFSLFG